MRQILLQKVSAAIEEARRQGELTGNDEPTGLAIQIPNIAEHGDWATNAALVMAKTEKKNPRDLAAILIKYIQDSEGYIKETTIAGPGFINFRLSHKWWEHVVADILCSKASYGRSDQGRGRKIQVEYVSANPTGPLHVGHGRGAALGNSIARLLSFSGWNVEQEYYINDAGNQMQKLGRSVLYRYYALFGRDIEFPEDFYQGDYIHDLAAELKSNEGDRYLDMALEEAVETVYPWAADKILNGIRQDLEAFGITYDHWFSEKSLYDKNEVDETLEDLKDRGFLYEEGGALWFATTRFGDDKDRVLIKGDGEKTYFASDIAYHRDKFRRGFDQVIDLWGADHGGYVPRMKAAAEALGKSRDQLELLLVQLVNLLRGGQPVSMSTRAGEFVTLRQVIDEVGSDAARFFFLTRSSDAHLDFDLEVAKSQTPENPVFYVQYAFARISSVFKKALDERGLTVPESDQVDLSLLVEEEELTLMKHLAAFPDTIAGAAAGLEPHRITHYLIDLSKRFHTCYNKHRIVIDDIPLSKARLALAAAIRQVVANGLDLLGVSAPEKM